MKTEDIKTKEQIIEYLKELYFFSGETCSNCKATSNELTWTQGHGYFCSECGHYNVTVIGSHYPLHTTPDYGPDKDLIQEARKTVVYPWDVTITCGKCNHVTKIQDELFDPYNRGYHDVSCLKCSTVFTFYING